MALLFFFRGGSALSQAEVNSSCWHYLAICLESSACFLAVVITARDELELLELLRHGLRYSFCTCSVYPSWRW